MRKLLLTLTAGFITMGAAAGAARADWDDHRGPVYREPVYHVPVYVAPVYRAPLPPAPVYYAPGYGAPVYAPLYRPYDPDWRRDAWQRHEAWERWHHEHDRD